MLQALRSSRDFRWLVVGELVSRAGTAASFVAVWSVAVYEFGVGPVGLSVLALCNTLPRVVTSMVAGRMVDRHGPRVVLLVANVLGLTGSLLQWASPGPVALGLASIVAGAGFGAFMPAIGSMSPRVVTDDHLLPANALLELTWQIGFIVGPLAGAVAILIGGTRAPLLFDAATFVVGTACVLAIHLSPVRPAAGVSTVGSGATAAAEPSSGQEPSAAAEGARERRGFRADLHATWAMPVARFVLVLNTGSWLGISFFIVLEPLYVEEVLGAGPAVLGLLQTAFGIGAVVGAALASRAERRLDPAVLAATIGLCGVGMIAYTVSHAVAVAAVGVGVWGIGIGLWAPLARTMIHRNVPVAQHGRVNGVMSSVQSGLEVVPVLLAGQLAVLVGIQATLIGAGITSVALAAWGWRAAAGVDRRQAALGVVLPEP